MVYYRKLTLIMFTQSVGSMSLVTSPTLALLVYYGIMIFLGHV